MFAPGQKVKVINFVDIGPIKFVGKVGTITATQPLPIGQSWDGKPVYLYEVEFSDISINRIARDSDTQQITNTQEKSLVRQTFESSSLQNVE